MEKTVNIGGQDVVLKSTGSLPLRYKAQFKTDFFSDMARMEKVFSQKEIDFEKMDLEIMYRVVWCMAKTANPDIPPMIEWIDTFDNFPLFNLVEEIQDLLINSIVGQQRKN